MTYTERWISHAEKQLSVAYSILATAEIAIGPRGAGDIKVLACTLLARTAGNVRGAILLARAGLVVEARTLARCCFENQFWIGGLVNEGESFVDRMRDDEIKSRQARAQFLFDTTKSLKAMAAPTKAKLQSMLRETRAKWPNAVRLNPKSVAGNTPVGDAYMIYSQLSADSAHPSVEALNRHVVTTQEGGLEIRGIDAAPLPRASELADTMNLACLALLGCCVGANQILEGTPGGKAINQLSDEYVRLAKGRAKHNGPTRTERPPRRAK